MSAGAAMGTAIVAVGTVRQPQQQKRAPQPRVVAQGGEHVGAARQRVVLGGHGRVVHRAAVAQGGEHGRRIVLERLRQQVELLLGVERGTVTASGAVLSRESMRDIPNSGRDYQSLTGFAPGVVGYRRLLNGIRISTT